MANTPAWRRGRTAATCVAAVLMIGGCKGVDSEESLPAPVIGTALDVSTEAEVQKTTRDFLATVQPGGAAVEGLLSSSSRVKANKLETDKAFQPFVGASDLAFDAIQAVSSGKKVVARVHFSGKDGKTYRTNLTMVREGDGFRIDDVLQPTSASKPVATGGQMSKL